MIDKLPVLNVVDGRPYLLDQRMIVGGEKDRSAEPVELDEKPHQALAHFRIDTAGRFVGQQKFGLGDDGAGNGGALLFPARKRRRFGIHTLTEAHPGQKLAHIGPVAGFLAPGHFQRQGDIFVSGEMVEQPEFLKNDADTPA
jgi:hypothetical protein